MKNTTIRYERHHKIPRNLGGTDDPENIITIPIEEHFIRHLNTAIALREARIRSDQEEISRIDPSGEDPFGNTHWYASALIYQRMYGYEIERVRKYISDDNFNTMMRYVLKLERGETDTNYTRRKKEKINDKIDDMFSSCSEGSDTRLIEMPNYGRSGEKTRYRVQKNWNGRKSFLSKYNA